MSNEYFAVSGSPATSSQGASATMRSEFVSVALGFDKLPTLSGNGSKLVQVNSGATALAAVTLTIGALLFGGAAGVLGQDGTNIFWDNTAKRLGIGNAAPTVALDVTGAGKFSTGLTVSAGGITATGNSTITGTLGGVTTLTASTSVVTPQVGPSTDIDLVIANAGASAWIFRGSANNYDLLPSFGSNTQSIGRGSPANIIKQIFTPIIDSGTTGSVLLKTNNGTTQFAVGHVASGVNYIQANSNVSGTGGQLVVQGETNADFLLQTRGTGEFKFLDGRTAATLLEIISVASGARNVTITSAAAGGNPTISTTAGSLAITPAVVMASSLVWGTGIANLGTIDKRKTSDQSRTSSAVLTNDTDLSFSIAANEEWECSFDIFCGANLNSCGVQVAITFPAGATANLQGNVLVGTTFNEGTLVTTSGTATINVNSGILAAAGGQIRVNLWILNGATPGTVQLQFAQGASNATSLTFFRGSSLKATRIA